MDKECKSGDFSLWHVISFNDLCLIVQAAAYAFNHYFYIKLHGRRFAKIWLRVPLLIDFFAKVDAFLCFIHATSCAYKARIFSRTIFEQIISFFEEFHFRNE